MNRYIITKILLKYLFILIVFAIHRKLRDNISNGLIQREKYMSLISRSKVWYNNNTYRDDIHLYRMNSLNGNQHIQYSLDDVLNFTKAVK